MWRNTLGLSAQPAYVCALVDQSCPTLWDPTDCGSPGSSVHGILQARILEWVEDETRHMLTKGKKSES